MDELGLSQSTVSQHLEELRELAGIIQEQRVSKGQVKLNFICTHNSRRSHISQLLAYASVYYLVDPKIAAKFSFFRGGTENS